MNIADLKINFQYEKLGEGFFTHFLSIQNLNTKFVRSVYLNRQISRKFVIATKC